MGFQTFAEEIAEMLRERMSDEYEIKIIRITKNNDVELTGIAMTRRRDSIFPTVYLESLYEEYRNGAAITSLVDRIINCYEEQSMALDLDLDMDFFRDYDKVRNRIFYKLVSFEKNRKFLLDAPYLRWHDLAIVFYYAMEESVVERASITIKREHMLMWKQNVESLFRAASYNTRREMPELLVSMRDLILELTGIRMRRKEALPMYVLTNQNKHYGASALLYSERIKDLAGQLHSDLLILPSSVHEVLLLPDDHSREYDSYRWMVADVNRTQLEPEEVLSYRLYRYRFQDSEIEEILS